MATILANRRIETVGEAERFLEPSLENLHDPFLMKGMDEGVDILASALKEKRRILVFGDYDVDGVTGTSLLVTYLRRFSDRVSYHIPHRIDEGYGLQSEVLRRFSAEGGGLVLTVDCGISNIEEIEEGLSLGLGFVVTDHHEPPSELPRAGAVINPLQPGCPYPFKQLAGVGIAFKLIQGLDRRLAGGDPSSAAPGPAILDLLDLVALGTVADIVPLQDENRVLVACGLRSLNARPRNGLRALKEVAGIGPRALKTSHIAFALGPRINAAGRLGRADMAVDLLLEKDPSKAWELAEKLNLQNRERQLIEAKILREATEMLSSDPSLLGDRAIVLASAGWHSGVIGVVASKLAERHSRPAILISTEGDLGKGSARSVPSFDLYSGLHYCSHLLETFGGHAYAAGLSIREERIPELRRVLNTLPMAESSRNRKTLDIDARICFGDLRASFLKEISLLMPFGYTNPTPTFVTEGVYPSGQVRTVGTNHLRLRFSQKRFVNRAIGFNLGGLASSLSPHLPVDVAYALDLDAAVPGTLHQLRLVDIHFPYSFEPPGEPH